MGQSFTKGRLAVAMEPMEGQHKIDPAWHGVTAELMDMDGEMWDAERGLVKLDPPGTGKMMKVTVSGRAIFYMDAEKRILLDHDI